MSEIADAAAPSAGRLLREARERQGLHIAALAAAIKVAPKKLELLEADRFADLPDATFTRALAQTVCRALKVDPSAVLQLLPPPAGHRLEHVSQGLNAPFRDRPGIAGQREPTGSALGPVFWITTLLLVAAVGLYVLPSGWLSLAGWKQATSRADPAASGVTASSTNAVAAPATASAALGSTAPTTVSEPVPPGAEPIPPGAEPIPAAAADAASAATTSPTTDASASGPAGGTAR